MRPYSEDHEAFNILRDKIVGLGEHSIKKNYYPELQKRIVELERSELKNKAILEAVPDMLILFDQTGVVLDYSPGRDLKLEYDREEIIGVNIREIRPSWIADFFIANAATILQKKEVIEFEHYLQQDNDARYFEIRSVLCGKNEVLFIIRDISERKNLEYRLVYMGTRDYLTGLYNRSYFEQVQQEMLKENKSGAGLVICDIDGLKLINDALGHGFGDIALKKSAEIIKECFPPNSVIARIGGDEFGVLIFESSAERIEEACNRISVAVDTYNSQGDNIFLSISTGFAYSDVPKNEGIEKLFTNADNEMYRKKLLRSKSTKNATVRTLMKAMEARDFITEGHAKRLEKVVHVLAKNMGLNESRINDIRLLAQFHDLGKVGIPDNILQKRGSLTQEERNIMQMHSLIGSKIANASAELAHIADLILKHHERWDGKGYPFGLQGENIPLECRILALADSYDAMINDRPYRNALPEHAAVAEIIKCSGTQFDPDLVSLFINLIDREAFIFE